MLASAIAIAKTGDKKGYYFIEVASKTALEENDMDFAWKAILLAQII